MQFPITIGLRRSLFLAWGIGIGHGFALMAVSIPQWSLAIRLALAWLVLGSAFLAWRRRLPVIAALRLQDDGTLRVRRRAGDEFVPATLLGSATVHPWLTTFRLQTDEGTLSVVVLPDSVAAEDFRRLRVWLHWRADFSGRDADA